MPKRKSQNGLETNAKMPCIATAEDLKNLTSKNLDVLDVPNKIHQCDKILADLKELLRTGLTVDSIVLVKKGVEECLAGELSLEIKHHTNTLYIMLFSYATENLANTPKELKEMLLSILNLIKAENLTEETSNLIFEIFAKHLTRTNCFDAGINDLILPIGKFATNVNTIFEAALRECQFAELDIISLAKFFLCANKSSLSKQSILLLVEKLFDKAAIKRSPKRLSDIITLSFRLTKLIGDENRSLIYENVLKIFMDINFLDKEYLFNKLMYTSAEKEALYKFKEEFKSLKDPFQISKKDSMYFEFAFKIKECFASYSMGDFVNRTFFAFNLITLNAEDHCLTPLNNQIISVMYKYFEAVAFKASNKWSDKSFKEIISELSITGVVKYHNLIVVLNEDDLINGLVKLTTRLLCRIEETKDGANNELVSKVNAYIIQFVSNILNDLVKYCDKAKSIILEEYLTKSMENSTRSHLFISQIDTVFNNENLREFYTSSSYKTKRLNLLKTIVQKFTNYYRSNESDDSYEELSESENEEDDDDESTNEELNHSPRPHDKEFNTLFHLKCANAINLIQSVRSFIFSSGNHQIESEENTLGDLVDFLTGAMGDKEKNHIAVYGLVNIMVSLNKCSFMKKRVQNGLMEQGGATTIEENNIILMCQDNARHSLLILNRLIANYDSWSENIAYKSHLLQSFFTLVSNNTPLIKEIATFLTNKLKAFTIVDDRANQRYFNLEKCCLFPPFANKSSLSEPLGILFDVAILCFKRGFESIKNDSVHEAYNVLSGLKKLCKDIVTTYLRKDTNQLFDIYNKQLIKVSKFQDLSSHLRHLQYGFFDSIIEYLILSDSHNEIIVILRKQAETTKLIKAEQTREERNRLTASKRKLNFDAEATEKAPTLRESKRFKASIKSSDKENAPPKTAKKNAHLNSRAPLANITHAKNVESNTIEANTGIQVRPSTSYLGEESDKLPKITTTYTWLEYVPIISYKSLLKMIQFCFSSREQMPDKQSIADSSKTVSLIVDGQFTDYALRVAEKKLKAFSQQKDARTWYDPELMDQNEILTFMSELWFSFTLRINGINAIHLTKKFKTSDASKSASNFNQANVEINNRIARLSQTLWELIPLDKKDVILRHNYGSVDAFSSSKSDTKKLTWDILLRLSANVNNYIVFPADKTIAFQYCASILNIMLKIVETVKLTNENYNSFQEWLFDLSKKVGSKEAGIGEMLVKLLFTISFKYDSPVSNIKYIALEQSVINATPVCTCPSSNNALYTNQNKIMKFTSLTEQFKFLTQSNSLSIHRLTFDCLTSWFKSVEWSINNYTYFDSNILIESMCKQLEITTSTLNYLIMSVSSIDSSDLVLKLVAHFYMLMDQLLKSDFVLKSINRENLYTIKSLIETVYASFNSKKISTELKKIHEIRAMANYSKKNEESSTNLNNDTLHFCIQKINSFEKCLVEFSKKNSLLVGMKFMEKYKTLLSTIEFFTGVV